MKARFLDDKELSEIFSHLSTDQRLVFDVCIVTGMRIGDVLKIRGQDVRRIAPELYEIRYKAEKTGKKGTATVRGSLGDHLYALRRKPRSFLWASRGKSGHITRQTAWNWFKAAARASKINIEGVSPHSLRKVFAVKLRHSEGMAAAQKALQHSDSATTAIYAYADIYAGADPNAPVLWCQVGELVDLIVRELRAKKDLS